VLLAERGAAHEADVRVERDAEAMLHVRPQRVRGVVARGARLDVAGEAGFDNHAPVVERVHQPRIFGEPWAMADAARTADVPRLADGFGAGTFAGMAGAEEAMLARVTERALVRDGGMPSFAAREVEPGNSLARVRDSEPR